MKECTDTISKIVKTILKHPVATCVVLYAVSTLTKSLYDEETDKVVKESK